MKFRNFASLVKCSFKRKLRELSLAQFLFNFLMFILHVWTQRGNFHVASGQSVAALSGEPQARAVSDVKPGESTEWSLATVDNLLKDPVHPLWPLFIQHY